jgi:sec-independent protein translocase protein TatA
MPGNIGLPEIAIVLIIALLVFGPKRLPEMGRSMGKGLREFKDSISGDDRDEHEEQVEKAPVLALESDAPAPVTEDVRHDQRVA